MDTFLWQTEEHTEFMSRGSYEYEGDTASRCDAAAIARVVMDLRKRIKELEERVK